MFIYVLDQVFNVYVLVEITRRSVGNSGNSVFPLLSVWNKLFLWKKLF